MTIEGCSQGQMLLNMISYTGKNGTIGLYYQRNTIYYASFVRVYRPAPFLYICIT